VRTQRISFWFLSALLFASFGLGFGILADRVWTSLSGEVALAWLTFIATTWFAIWSFQKTKRKEAEALLFSQKSARVQGAYRYHSRHHVRDKGLDSALDQDELAQRLGRVRYDMIVWGGQDTIRAIEKFESSSATGEIGPMFAAVAGLYATVRRDLGHSDDGQLAEDLFLAQIVLEERENVRALVRGDAGPGVAG
jgi:hypothetical protein